MNDNDNFTHKEQSVRALDQVREIGKTYGRLIFQKAAMFSLSAQDIELEVDAAVSDLREDLIAGNLNGHDVKVACDVLKRAILREGELTSDKPEGAQ